MGWMSCRVTNISHLTCIIHKKLQVCFITMFISEIHQTKIKFCSTYCLTLRNLAVGCVVSKMVYSTYLGTFPPPFSKRLAHNQVSWWIMQAKALIFLFLLLTPGHRYAVTWGYGYSVPSGTVRVNNVEKSLCKTFSHKMNAVTVEFLEAEPEGEPLKLYPGWQILADIIKNSRDFS